MLDSYFDAGVKAFNANMTAEANPHPMDAAPRRLWRMGFDYAELKANEHKVNAEPLEYVEAKPFDQGMNAHAKGLRIDANPYDFGDPHGTPDERKTYDSHMDWKNGFIKAVRLVRDYPPVPTDVDKADAVKYWLGPDAKPSPFVIDKNGTIDIAELAKSSPALFVQQVGRAVRPVSGGHNDYWRVKVKHPTREGVEPYIAEFEDIAEALKLTPREYNEAKAIWRTAGARLGNGKPGVNALYDAQKRVHYAKLDLATYEREAVEVKDWTLGDRKQPSEEDRQP